MTETLPEGHSKDELTTDLSETVELSGKRVRLRRSSENEDWTLTAHLMLADEGQEGLGSLAYVVTGFGDAGCSLADASPGVYEAKVSVMDVRPGSAGELTLLVEESGSD